jgi:hypothetical protein
MIPYDIDPSLHAGQPEPPRLDDGFSPPAHEEPPALQLPDHHVEPVLWAKSPF